VDVADGGNQTTVEVGSVVSVDVGVSVGRIACDGRQAVRVRDPIKKNITNIRRMMLYN
jgi:hypothetical protein